MFFEFGLRFLSMPVLPPFLSTEEHAPIFHQKLKQLNYAIDIPSYGKVLLYLGENFPFSDAAFYQYSSGLHKMITVSASLLTGHQQKDR